MTVKYNLHVSTASRLLNFTKVLLLWKGSVWKLICTEMIVWYTLVIVVLLLDRFIISKTPHAQDYHNFLKWLGECCPSFIETLPFLLGFTTAFCYERWFAIFNCLDWPNSAAHLLNTFMRRHKMSRKRESKLRATFARHLRLAYILIFRDISMSTRRQVPTLDAMLDAELITQKELIMLKEGGRLSEDACRYWIPLQWIVVRIREMRAADKRNSLMSDFESLEFFDEIAKLRGNLGDLLSYDWVPMPIAFMQIITAAVYATMMITVFSIQCDVVNDESEIDFNKFLWTKFIKLFELLLYTGWMKSVHVIINPFGEDDDDFEMDWLLDHHNQVLNALLLHPDSGHHSAPPKVHPDTTQPNLQLPHTIGSLIGAQKESGIKVKEEPPTKKTKEVEDKPKRDRCKCDKAVQMNRVTKESPNKNKLFYSYAARKCNHFRFLKQEETTTKPECNCTMMELTREWSQFGLTL